MARIVHAMELPPAVKIALKGIVLTLHLRKNSATVDN
jgi:hypothetical protein